MRFGEYAYFKRNQNDMTLEELAKRLITVSPSKLSKLEKYDPKWELPLIYQLSKLYNMTVAEMLTEFEAMDGQYDKLYVIPRKSKSKQLKKET